MSNTIPAGNLARLHTRTAEGETITVPIVAFSQPSLTNPIAFPVLLIGRSTSGMTERDGIVFTSDGLVNYPFKSMVFTNLNEFETWIDDHVTGEGATTKTPAAPNFVMSNDSTKPLNWGAETFKTKSFWHWKDVNAVFTIEKDNVIPVDARVVKIKRDEFDAIRKAGAVMIDPHNGLIEKEKPAEAAPAAPAEEDFV